MHETTLDWCKWNFQNGFFPESSIDILVELSSYLIASKFGKMQMEFVSSAHLELLFTSLLYFILCLIAVWRKLESMSTSPPAM